MCVEAAKHDAARGDMAGAERWLRAACPPDSDSVECLNAGTFAKTVPQLAQLAVPLWEQSCGGNSPSEACCKLGQLEEEAGRRDEALAHYQRFCSNDQVNPAQQDCCNGVSRLSGPRRTLATATQSFSGR
jgi:hypothetical protein